MVCLCVCVWGGSGGSGCYSGDVIGDGGGNSTPKPFFQIIGFRPLPSLKVLDQGDPKLRFGNDPNPMI